MKLGNRIAQATIDLIWVVLFSMTVGLLGYGVMAAVALIVMWGAPIGEGYWQFARGAGAFSALLMLGMGMTWWADRINRRAGEE